MPWIPTSTFRRVGRVCAGLGLLTMIVTGCVPRATPTPVRIALATVTATPTATVTPSATATQGSTSALPLSATPTATPTGTSIPTDQASATASPAATAQESPPSGTPTNAPGPATPTMPPTPTISTAPIAQPTQTRTPTAVRSLTPTPVATLNASGHVGLGLYADGLPYDRFASAQRFEILVRHKMLYVLWFTSWGGEDRAFPTEYVRLAADNGWIPILTWEPWVRNFGNLGTLQPAYSLSSIASGQHDEYIRSWARAARAVNVPIVLRFAHEQSTEPGKRIWYPWQGDPEGYKAAFRHIVSIFRQERADKVQHLWSAMWLNSWAEEYYPGPEYVDWVGTTILNHGTSPPTEFGRWYTFRDLFWGQYQAALAWGKPIMLTELASADQGGDKAIWVREAFVAMAVEFPLVQAVALLEVTSDREWPQINWSVSSSRESLIAFRESVTGPYFK